MFDDKLIGSADSPLLRIFDQVFRRVDTFFPARNGGDPVGGFALSHFPLSTRRNIREGAAMRGVDKVTVHMVRDHSDTGYYVLAWREGDAYGVTKRLMSASLNGYRLADWIGRKARIASEPSNVRREVRFIVYFIIILAIVFFGGAAMARAGSSRFDAGAFWVFGALGIFSLIFAASVPSIVRKRYEAVRSALRQLGYMSS